MTIIIRIIINFLTSKIKVAFGGIFGGEPFAPYAYSLLQVILATSPFLIVATPMSQAFITSPEIINTLETSLY